VVAVPVSKKLDRPPRVMVSVRLLSKFMPTVVQRQPDDFFGALTVEATEHGVRASYRSLTQRWEQGWCPYSDIDPNPMTWETGEGSWSHVAWRVLPVGLAASLMVSDDLRRPVAAVTVFIAAGMFLQQFIKRRFLAFYTVGGGQLFTLKMPSGQEVVNYVLARVAESKRDKLLEE
jgi:hypothetical protein